MSKVEVEPGNSEHSVLNPKTCKLCLVPPDPVLIYDEEGKERMTFVGPYEEGQDARLTCTAFGGQYIFS